MNKTRKIKKSVNQMSGGKRFVVALFGVALLTVAVIMAVTNAKDRIEALKTYKGYEITKGTVVDYTEEEYENSEGDKSTKYGLVVEYERDANTLRATSEAIYSFKPFSKKYHVMYNDTNTYVATFDFITFRYLPVECDYNSNTTFVLLVLGMGLFCLSFTLKAQKAIAWCSTLALLLIGLAGIFGFLFTPFFWWIFLLPFGLVGLYTLKRILSGEDLKISVKG